MPQLTHYLAELRDDFQASMITPEDFIDLQGITRRTVFHVNVLKSDTSMSVVSVALRRRGRLIDITYAVASLMDWDIEELGGQAGISLDVPEHRAARYVQRALRACLIDPDTGRLVGQDA